MAAAGDVVLLLAVDLAQFVVGLEQGLLLGLPRVGDAASVPCRLAVDDRSFALLEPLQIDDLRGCG